MFTASPNRFRRLAAALAFTAFAIAAARTSAYAQTAYSEFNQALAGVDGINIYASQVVPGYGELWYADVYGGGLYTYVMGNAATWEQLGNEAVASGLPAAYANQQRVANLLSQCIYSGDAWACNEASRFYAWSYDYLDGANAYFRGFDASGFGLMGR